jgi:DNA polymerase III subunit epsilon
MSGLNFYIIDTETTGLSTKLHEVVEVSIIRCSDRVQLTEFIKCEQPENVSVDALRITNKTLADLQKGGPKEEIVDKIDEFLSKDGLTPAHRCFVAHNSPFDMKFMHALYDKVGKRCPVDNWKCTMALTRAYAKKIGLVKPKVNLHAACDILQIKKISEAHASKVDSRNTFLLWKALIEDKNMDYLPLIKNAIHNAKPADDDDDVDLSLLDF